MAPFRRKPVGESGTIATISRAGRKKEQFRVEKRNQWGPYRQTKVEAEADLLYARDAATHDEFADRLRKLHEEKAPLRRKPVCECGTIASAGRKKEQFRVITSKQIGPTRQTRAEAEADLQYARDAATHAEFADRLRKLHELTGRCKRMAAKGEPQACSRPLAGGAALDGSLVTASAAPWVDMHHSPCKRKGNFDSGTDVAVLDGSSAPSDKRLRVESGGG